MTLDGLNANPGNLNTNAPCSGADLTIRNSLGAQVCADLPPTHHWSPGTAGDCLGIPQVIVSGVTNQDQINPLKIRGLDRAARIAVEERVDEDVLPIAIDQFVRCNTQEAKVRGHSLFVSLAARAK